MNPTFETETPAPSDHLRDMIAFQGPLALAAAFVAALTRPLGQRPIMRVPEHLRDDVGLPEFPRETPMAPGPQSIGNPLFRL